MVFLVVFALFFSGTAMAYSNFRPQQEQPPFVIGGLRTGPRSFQKSIPGLLKGVCRSSERKKRYDGHRLLGITSGSIDSGDALVVIDALNYIGVDFWTPIEAIYTHGNGSRLDEEVDILVSPEKYEVVRQLLRAKQLRWRVKTENVQKLLDAENVFAPCLPSDDGIKNPREYQAKNQNNLRGRLQISASKFLSVLKSGPDEAVDRAFDIFAFAPGQRRKQSSFARQEVVTRPPEMNWIAYHRLATIYAYLYQLETLYPHLVKVLKIGRSVKGRDMLVAKVGKARNFVKPAIFIEAGIHGREWISPATATFFLHELVAKYPANRNIVDFFDIYILPVANPDGYEYSHTDNRFWRKNRRNANAIFPQCGGVDLNRNFGMAWGGYFLNTVSGSPQRCTDTYRGSGPFSEPESKAIRNFVTRIRNQLVMYLSFHSYGQKIIYPWSYTNKKLPDWKDLDTVGRIIAKAINTASKGVYQYEVGTSPNLNYYATGGSDDWARGRAGIKWVFLLELPDHSNGVYGFVLPASHILPVALSVFEGFKAGIAEVSKGLIK